MASQIAALAEALVAARHVAAKRLFTAVASFVGFEIAELAEALATVWDTAEIGFFAAVGADVDE